jgi:aspartate/methionine/tyrosine aminotransferase
VNLGQGFPSWSPPQFVRDALVNAANNPAYTMHQYARPNGIFFD